MCILLPLQLHYETLSVGRSLCHEPLLIRSIHLNVVESCSILCNSLTARGSVSCSWVNERASRTGKVRNSKASRRSDLPWGKPEQSFQLSLMEFGTWENKFGNSLGFFQSLRVKTAAPRHIPTRLTVDCLPQLLCLFFPPLFNMLSQFECSNKRYSQDLAARQKSTTQRWMTMKGTHKILVWAGGFWLDCVCLFIFRTHGACKEEIFHILIHFVVPHYIT